MGAHGRSGFSRPEMVFALGAVLFVASLVIPGRLIWREHQREAMTRADIRALLEAARSYYAEYGAWPTTLSGGIDDVRYGRDVPNREVINILRAVDGPGNLGHRTNRRKIAFLDVPEYQPGLSGRDEEGNLVDAWGTQYQLILDASLDNVCISSTTIYGRREGEGVLIWSCGPDGMSDTRDDILSWVTDAAR